MQRLTHDLLYTLRQLRRAPGFALTAVLTLALGVGATTAIFSLLNQALLRSLPVRDPQQLVILEGTGNAWQGHASSHGGDKEAYFSYPMYRDLRDHATGRQGALSGLIATAPADIGITQGTLTQAGRAELVSGNYFSVLGVQAALGRVFTQGDDTQPGANPVVVLGYDYWRDHLGADPALVGSTIAVNGHPFVVAGVAARGFRSAIWGESPSLFVPMSMLDVIVPGKGLRLTDHTDKWINILGRLAFGRRPAEAELALAPLWYSLRAEELKALGTQSAEFVDDFLTRSRLRLVPGARGFSYDRDQYRTPLLAVSAMALLVLLMASVNVTSLLMVRAAGRVREFSLRYALGAGVGQVARQLLTEGLVLGLAGGTAGMLLAPLAVRALVRRLAGDQPYSDFSPSIDARSLAFNFTVALAVSVAFSLAPILQLRRARLSSALQQQAGTGPGGLQNFRRAVVCLQIGLSLLLLAGAGLFVRTMQNLKSVDVGFRTAHLVTFGINPKLAGIAPSAVPALDQRLVQAFEQLPGVEAVAATDDPELADSGQGGNVTVSGHNDPSDPSDRQFDVEEPYINPGFFHAMQVPLLAGRFFTGHDTADHPRVAIVNESFAKHFCGTADACLGRQASTGGSTAGNIEIVGVVRDTRHEGIRSSISPTLFQPLQQQASPGVLFFYLRTAGDPAQMLTVIPRAVHQLAPALALTALRTMDAQIDDNLANDRVVVLLAVSFGILAATLAGVGLYGVLAYATEQRTREIGIRIALGSTRAAVATMMLKDVLLLSLIGIAGALPLALGLARLIRSQLFAVSPTDPVAFVAAVALIALVAILAALLPARRAASIEPVQALRIE